MSDSRRAYPASHTPYVVVELGPDRNSAGEWAAQGPLPRLRLPIQQKIQLTPKLSVLQDEQQTKQHREQLLEHLVEQLLELLAIQLREQLVIQVEIQVAIQVQTLLSTQANTQFRILLKVLPGELLRILRETQLTIPSAIARDGSGRFPETVEEGSG